MGCVNSVWSFGVCSVIEGVPFHTRRACLCTRRPGLVEGHYGESRLSKATILHAGGGVEDSLRPVTRQRHKRHVALDQVSVTPLHEVTSSRAMKTYFCEDE